MRAGVVSLARGGKNLDEEVCAGESGMVDPDSDSTGGVLWERYCLFDVIGVAEPSYSWTREDCLA